MWWHELPNATCSHTCLYTTDALAGKAVSGMTSRQCARPGCRAWAMRGMMFCSSHRRGEHSDESKTQPDGRRERSDLFAEMARAGRHDELVERTICKLVESGGGDLSLSEEIGSLRLILRRVMAVDGLDSDPKDTAQTVARLANAIVYAVQAQRAISGRLADDLTEALTTILIEMGMGGSQ